MTAGDALEPILDPVEPRMQEVAAGGRLEFPCSACGATLQFDPEASGLACEYCGHSEVIPGSAEGVVEHSFEEYERPSQTGWGTETRTYDCRTCGARTTVEASVTSFTCPFCESNQVDPTILEGRIRPESLLPFAFDREAAVVKFKGWVGGLWFRPSALKDLARVDRVHGVYLPHWTYDALTKSFWEAEAGYHYYEDEDYTDAEGNRKTRQVQRTRWESADGRHEAFFDDVLVQATGSVDGSLLAQIYPFDTQALVAYDPRFLAGWAAEDYGREMPDCWPAAKSRIDSSIRSACARLVPGDTHRNLRVRTSYLNRTFKLCLLPVWVASYRFGDEVWPVLINGQTGRVRGKAPYSWAKIVGLALAILGAGGAIFFLLAAAGAVAGS